MGVTKQQKQQVGYAEQLVAINRYNPGILPDLENHVNEQQMEEQFKTLIVLSHYLEAINIKGLALDKFLEHQVANSGWMIEKGYGKGQLIVIPKNEFNDLASKRNAANSVQGEIPDPECYHRRQLESGGARRYHWS